MLVGLNGEQFRLATANQRLESRLDINASGFWTPGQRLFLDVRVFDLNAQRHKNLELQKCYKQNEDEKKKMYKRLAQMIPEKRSIDCSIATNFVRTKISFSLLRSTLMCVRGSRSFKRDFDYRY